MSKSKLAQQLIEAALQIVGTEAWETKPKGWTSKSLKEFWSSIGGSTTKCMEKMKGKIDDPGAYCASLKRKLGK